ncbi:MAG: tol-pal system protein YbgF [Desulfuromonadaceae bacterium]|nr:tol-pal system protein YbgF [Desulfuromonadaceae bacterium]MDD2853943.1 tol-pal system protein YbgF [Desulfuromonadaceae bacterium]
MPSVSRMVACLFISFLLSGCAANDIIVKRQAEAEAKIEFLIQTSKKSEQRQNELAGLLQSEREKFQAVDDEIKVLKDENRSLKAFRDEFSVKVAWLVQQAQTPKVEIVNQPSAVKTTTESDPPEEYLKSFGLYSANNFADAIEAFKLFLKNNPESSYAANALYWIGECHYTLSDLVNAKEAFLRVTELYPKSSKAPDAFLKLGYTLSGLNQKEESAAVFEKIITMYPSSHAAKKARERLNAR